MSKCPVDSSHKVKAVVFNTFSYDYCEECKEAVSHLLKNIPPPLPNNNELQKERLLTIIEREINDALYAGEYPLYVKIIDVSRDNFKFKVIDKITKKVRTFTSLDQDSQESIDIAIDYLLKKYQKKL